MYSQINQNRTNSNFLNVTCSHEMDIKLHHAVLSIGLKTVVGVNLGETEVN